MTWKFSKRGGFPYYYKATKRGTLLAHRSAKDPNAWVWNAALNAPGIVLNGHSASGKAALLRDAKSDAEHALANLISRTAAQ